MSRKLFWKLCLLFAAGIVALFYCIHQLAIDTEEGMSLLAEAHRQELLQWGRQAETFYRASEFDQLKTWLQALQIHEQSEAAVVEHKIRLVQGRQLDPDRYTGFNLGRSIDWKIHLYFDRNPVMELPFQGGGASLLIVLPDRMRPGRHWQTTRIFLLIILPMLMLAVLAIRLYCYIMQPLRQLQQATRAFARGDYSVRISPELSRRKDEFSELSKTFDQMAERIGKQLVAQRQLIADLSHELRTPLTRLDIALEFVKKENERALQPCDTTIILRVERESKNIRRLVDDALSLAWLENENPVSRDEQIDLVDLCDVIVEDARFEFTGKQVLCRLPANAPLKNSNHRAVGQALENILRNALRYTAKGGSVELDLSLNKQQAVYILKVKDRGPGVDAALLETIFQPFFRIDKSRSSQNDSFGLGLALARRQLAVVGASVYAENRDGGGLSMTLVLPVS
ncbi:sensor histidine kinase [Agaribacterium haliotis]|uniref:sensor histidine kinase n=1 Tax=Agaribacterium haliotis TaxID=2013869 RepID=UPI0018645AB1|nr:histidine kinase sensor domain-containing protein [Agaribacterium haliotis]